MRGEENKSYCHDSGLLPTLRGTVGNGFTRPGSFLDDRFPNIFKLLPGPENPVLLTSASVLIVERDTVSVVTTETAFGSNEGRIGELMNICVP